MPKIRSSNLVPVASSLSIAPRSASLRTGKKVINKPVCPLINADKDAVLAAVAQNGKALQYASEDLKADKDAVLAAVAQNGKALRFASENIRADKDVVLAAVAQNGEALRFASTRLRRAGLRKHLIATILAHRSFVFFLFGAKSRPKPPPAEGPAPPHPRVAAEECVLSRLNAHGPHFAVHLKRRISDFVGVCTGRANSLVYAAAKNIGM